MGRLLGNSVFTNRRFQSYNLWLMETCETVQVEACPCSEWKDSKVLNAKQLQGEPGSKPRLLLSLWLVWRRALWPILTETVTATLSLTLSCLSSQLGCPADFSKSWSSSPSAPPRLCFLFVQTATINAHSWSNNQGSLCILLCIVMESVSSVTKGAEHLLVYHGRVNGHAKRWGQGKKNGHLSSSILQRVCLWERFYLSGMLWRIANLKKGRTGKTHSGAELALKAECTKFSGVLRAQMNLVEWLSHPGAEIVRRVNSADIN